MAEGVQEVKLAIKGMTCGGCASSLERALRTADGVQEAQVTFEGAEAVVRYDPAQTDPQKLLQVVDRAGFDGALHA